MTAADPSRPDSSAPDTPATPAAVTLTRRQRLGRAARRGARWSAWGLLALIIALLIGGTALWHWSANDQSLATVIRIIRGYLPEHMTLEAEGVSGSVRRGGHVERLIWASQGVEATGHTGGEMVVTLDTVDVEWDLATLWDRATRFSLVHVRTATLQDTREKIPPTEPEPPLQDFTLPVNVELPFIVDTLRIVGKPKEQEDIRYQSPDEAAAAASAAKVEQQQQQRESRQQRMQKPAGSASDPAAAVAELAASAAEVAASAARGDEIVLDGDLVTAPTNDTVITNLRGLYRYDRVTAVHDLRLDSIQVANGRYQGTARIKGRAPMNSQLQLHGTLELPASQNMPAQRLQAEASAHGTLSGFDALLHVEAKLAPLAVEPGVSASSAPQPRQPQAPSSTQVQDVAQGTRLQLRADVHPWRTQPLARAQASWQQLDLQAFLPSLPRSRLQGSLSLEPDASQPDGAASTARVASAPATAASATVTTNEAPGMLGFLGNTRWLARTDIRNDDSGRLDQGLLPLARLQAELRYDHGALDITQLLLDQGRGGGTLQGQGRYLPDTGWLGDFEIRHLNPGLIDTRFAAAPLSGTVTARSELQPGQAIAQAPIRFSAQLRSDGGSRAMARGQGLALDLLDVQGQWKDRTVELPVIQLRTLDAALQGSARYAVDTQAASGQLALRLPGGSAQLQGTLSEASGQGTVQARVQRLDQTLAWLRQLPGMGSLGAGQAIGGAATLDARWNGGWGNQGRNMRLDGTLEAPSITLRSSGQTAAQQMNILGTRLTVQGTLAQAQVSGRTRIEQQMRRMQLALSGTAGKQAQGWQARLQATELNVTDQLQNKQWQAQLASPTQIQITQGNGTLQVQTSAITINLSGASVAGQAQILAEPIRFVQRAGGYTLYSKGRLSDIPLSWLDALASSSISGAGFSGDMAMAGNWDVELGNAMRVRATLARSRGDLEMLVDGRTLRTGVRDARLEIEGSGGNLQTRLLWDSSQAGSANAQISTRLSRSGGGWTLSPAAPIQGTLRADMPRVGVWSMFAPPGWRIRGTLQADLAVGGNLRRPLINGTIAARELGVRSVVDGIEFDHGRMQLRLAGERMVIEELTLQGPTVNRQPGGSARVTGTVDWSGASSGRPLLQAVRMSLRTELQGLQLSSMPERQITLSGMVTTTLADMRLTARGELKVDRALIEIPSDSTPQLDSDVVVLPSKKHPKATLAMRKPNAEAQAIANDPKVKAATARTNSSITPDIQIKVSMGDDLRVRGFGLNTRLRGQLEVQNGPTLQSLPLLVGTIRTDRGTYRAYGQELDIERGTMRFTGRADNPLLDIMAIRPNLGDLRVGVHIRGTAQRPLVQLFSDPAMPDSEKLSWLVLGRSAASASDTALLQQAAMALLAGSGPGITGQLADALGLDSLSFAGDGLENSSVMLGKRFSRNFYVAYEHGINSAMGTLYFFYDINRRLKLRGETGAESAIDLIYTMSFD